MKKAILILVSVSLILGAFAWHFFFRSYALLPSVERFVQGFYDTYNNRDFNYIYEVLSHQKIRANMDEDRFMAMMEDSRNRLGSVEGRKRLNWKARFGRNGTYIFVQYRVKHSSAAADENFTLIKRNKEWFVFDYVVRVVQPNKKQEEA